MVEVVLYVIAVAIGAFFVWMVGQGIWNIALAPVRMMIAERKRIRTTGKNLWGEPVSKDQGRWWHFVIWMGFFIAPITASVLGAEDLANILAIPIYLAVGGIVLVFGFGGFVYFAIKALNPKSWEPTEESKYARRIAEETEQELEDRWNITDAEWFGVES